MDKLGISFYLWIEGEGSNARSRIKFIEFNEDYRGRGQMIYNESDRFEIRSAGSPQLISSVLYTPGDRIEEDNHIASKFFNNKEAAIAYNNKIIRAFNELSIRETGKGIPHYIPDAIVEYEL